MPLKQVGLAYRKERWDKKSSHPIFQKGKSVRLQRNFLSSIRFTANTLEYSMRSKQLSALSRRSDIGGLLYVILVKKNHVRINVFQYIILKLCNRYIIYRPMHGYACVYLTVLHSAVVCIYVYICVKMCMYYT